MQKRSRAAPLAALWVLLAGCHATHPAPYVPQAPVPPEGPASMSDVQAGMEYDEIVQAQSEIPALRTRYQSGLARGDTLFLRVVRPEENGLRDEVVLKVTKWSRGRVHGFVALEPVDFPTSAVSDVLEVFDDAAAIDWIIVKADGSQEGNRLRYGREERWK
jgi:hypothetical protein